MKRLPEHQVVVEALCKEGRWAQEPWKPQLEVKEGDKVTISISIAYRLEKAGLARILKEEPKGVAKQVKAKDESNPAKKDKKAAQG